MTKAIDKKRYVAFVCIALSWDICSGFLPNQFSTLVGPKDFTHADITEIGILNAVAKYFETVPAPGKSLVSPGTLTGIQNITTRKLYDAYYGATVSERHFQDAIDNIIRYNNQVDQDHYAEAAWHFNGEKINEGHQKLKQLRDTALSILNKASPDYEAAREVIGQYLHLLQMFYSNSNWIEMRHKAEINPELGTNTLSTQVYGPSDITCKSCGASIIPRAPCFLPFLTMTAKLTSSYRSGQDVQKPFKDPSVTKEGKCSHGGPTDIFANTSAALGGINKDTDNSHYSPHFNMHSKAAIAAINHTTYFFDDPSYGLRKQIGDSKFKQLLQLTSGKSLVFVIDTSGSMKSDVAAITQKTKEIVSQTQGTTNEPSNYILVTFSDPGNKTKVQKSTNANDILTWLGAISVHGGGDCPEFSLTGIQAAAVAANPNSQIYVFTDSTPKDSEKRQFIESIGSEKNIHIDFIITGSCYPSNQKYVQKRSLGSHPIRLNRYQRSVNEKFPLKAEFMKNTTTTPDDKTHVLILRKRVDSSQSPIVQLPVDSTISRLDITIKGSKAMPHPVIQKPDGTNMTLVAREVKLQEYAGHIINIEVDTTAIPPGIWNIYLEARDSWLLDVYGKGMLRFKPEFMRNGNSSKSELVSLPEPGLLHDVIVRVNDIDSIKSLFHLYLEDWSGNVLTSSILTRFRSDTTRRSFQTKVMIPSQSYRIAIDGLDKNEHKFRRVDEHVFLTKKSYSSADQHEHLRVKRSTVTSWNGIDTYKLIAQQSGGHLYETTKSDVGQTIDLVKSFLTSSSITIMRYSSRGGTTGCSAFIVPVDTTCSKFSILIKADKGQPRPILYKPDGSTASMASGSGITRKTVGNFLILEIDHPDAGRWSISKSDYYNWEVEVTAESKVDFYSKFLEIGQDGYSLFEIKGQPTGGLNQTVSITLNSMDHIQSIDDFVMLDRNGDEIAHYPLTQKPGRHANCFTAEVTIPEEAFQIAIDGTDKGANDFRRVHTNLISTVALKLESLPISDHFYTHEKLHVPFMVTNIGLGSTTVEVTISDDKNFALAPKSQIITLTGGENVTSYFVLEAGNTDHETTTVTIAAEPAGARGASFQYALVKLTTEKRTVPRTDKVPPHCAVTSMTNYCGPDDCTCATSYIAADVEIWDEGFGLKSIIPSGHGNGILLHANFTKNQTKEDGIIKATLITDCCRKNASIDVEDMDGQKGNCTIDVNSNYDNRCTTTTTSTTPTTTTTTSTTSTTTTTPTTTTTTPTTTPSTTTTTATTTTTPSTTASTSTTSTSTSQSTTTTTTTSTSASTTSTTSQPSVGTPAACICPNTSSSVSNSAASATSKQTVSTTPSSGAATTTKQSGNTNNKKTSATSKAKTSKPTSTTKAPEKESDSGVSTGAKIGVATGASVVAVGFIAGGTYLIKKKMSSVSPD